MFVSRHDLINIKDGLNKQVAALEDKHAEAKRQLLRISTPMYDSLFCVCNHDLIKI